MFFLGRLGIPLGRVGGDGNYLFFNFFYMLFWKTENWRIFLDDFSEKNIWQNFTSRFEKVKNFKNFLFQNADFKIFIPDAPTDLGDFSFFALPLIERKRQITCYVWGGGGMKIIFFFNVFYMRNFANGNSLLLLLPSEIKFLERL